jgi:hypothetical protein
MVSYPPHMGHKKQKKMRSWGRTEPRVLKEQQEGPCGWSRGSEGDRGRGSREGAGRSCRALWAAGRTWALSLREVGAMEGRGQGREGPHAAHGRPLVAVGG